MDSSRRLQQLQQANSHLAPLAAPQLGGDYRPRSPLFPQIPSTQVYNNNPQDGSKTPLLQQYTQQNPYERRYDEYERTMSSAPLLMKQQTHHHHHENEHQQQQQQLLQQHPYQPATMMRGSTQQFHAHQMYQQFPNHNHHIPPQQQLHIAAPQQQPTIPPQQPSTLPNSASSSSISSRSNQQPALLQEQYRQLQRARTQQRIECQARAALNQQRTFAARQAALAAASGNPAIACASPVPSVVVSVTPASNSRLQQGSEDGFSQDGSMKRSGMEQEGQNFNNANRRPPGPGIDNSQHDTQGYPGNKRMDQDNQSLPRRNDTAQPDNQMYNQRRQMEDNNQQYIRRQQGNEENQMMLNKRRPDNHDPIPPPIMRKGDGSENQNLIPPANNNKPRDNVRSPVTVMQPPPTSINNPRREVLPPNTTSASTRERMQSPVPNPNMLQHYQQAPQVPPKPSAQTARHAQQNLYVQPHSNNPDQSIISPVGSPGAPTYASSPANINQNSPQKYNQSNMMQHGQQYYNQQSNLPQGTNQFNQQFNYQHQQNNQFHQQNSDQITSQPSTPQHHPTTQPQRSKSIASSITSSISSNSIMVRGPIARRPADSVVTISGWLHKQGCDGLKVWRKRWFVLTDYCLFYYKGQEEEKLLGSILLPSYTVSICTPDEKHHRKNSFKCEHANMRTYVLAADTPEAMALWVRALRDACTMQCDETSHQSQPSVSTITNSDTSASLQQHAANTNQQQMMNQQQQQILNQQQQPLYANAPHRMRTPNAPSCYSPNPENQEKYEESIYTTRPQSRRMQQEMARSPIPSDAIYETQHLQQNRIPQQVPNISNLHPGQNQSYTMDHNAQKQHQAYLMAQRQNAYKTMPAATGTRDLRSPYDMEAPYVAENPDNIIRAPRRFQNPNEEYDQYVQNNVAQGRPMQKSNERRTPDTYGRSRHARQQYSMNAANALSTSRSTIDPSGAISPHPTGGDYEDLYNSYKRPMSPAPNSPTSLTGPPPLNPQSRAELERRGIILPHGYNDEQPMAQVQMRNKRQPTNPPYQSKKNAIPRPHSADFLEYETKATTKPTPSMQAVSAHNLAMNQNQPSMPASGEYGGGRSARERLMRQRPKSSLDMPISDQMYYSEKSYAEMMRQSALYVDAVKSGGMDGTGTRQRILGGGRMYEDGVANDTSISNKLHSMHLSNDQQNYDEEIREMSRYSQNREFVNSYSVPRQGKDQPSDNGSNQFARSASARLFRNNKDQDQEPPSSEQGAKKVQQREESMKRLLEWKQRMLQAPLTRQTNSVSSSTNINRTMSPAPLYPDGSHTINSVAKKQQQQRQSSYNSYSSDDEASITNKLGVYTKSSTLPMRTVSPRLRLSQETLLQQQPTTNQQLLHNATKTDYDKYYRRNLYKYEDNISDANYDQYGSREEGFLSGSTEMFVDAEYGSNHNLLSNEYGDYADRSYGLRRTGSQVDDMNFIERDQINRHLNVSAGDLLGRTHEELVLLLIQLRRQNAATARAMEQCCSKIHQYQSRLGKQSDDSKQRQENLQKLNALKRHLLDLEKQYEKGKPLVNLVDNMVKLGALYKGNGKSNLQKSGSSYLNDKLEFNQRLEEQRLLKEEQKFWDSGNIDEQQLQNKMRQLQEYGEQLREQSNTLQGLRKDEESLRGALASLKTRMQQGQQAKQNTMQLQNATAAGRVELLEKAREQERALERELTKVRELLANNSKKLENTLSANSRAEDELRVMTHRFQGSKSTSGSQQQLMHLSNGTTNNNQTDSVPYAGGASALLESELRRVQEVVGDIQRQRQELSLAVRELTDRSQYVDRDILPKQTLTSNASIKKRPQATWLETDLDLMITLEHGINIEGEDNSTSKNNLYKSMMNNTASNNGSALYSDGKNQEDEGDSDSETNAFGGLNINSQDRGEIKTVRIVKRESERRHRDRSEKTHSWGLSNNTSNLDNVLEEDTTRPKSVFESNTSHFSYDKDTSYSTKPPSSNYPYNYSTDNLLNSKYNSNEHISSSQNLYGTSDYSSTQNLYGSRDLKSLSKCESIVSLSKSAELSPVFHSQAAKEIISTINVNDVKSGSDKYSNSSEVMMHKRQVPKEKRRHYTAPTNDINMDSFEGSADTSYNKPYDYRARDDMDMERALRTKTEESSTIITSGSNSNAPDLVRSTIQDSLTKSSYAYGSNYLDTSDRKNPFGTKYNNKEDNYMDMSYSSKTTKTTTKDNDYRNFDDLSPYSTTRKVDFSTTKDNDYIHRRSTSLINDKNYFNDDSFMSKESKYKSNDDDLGSDSLSSDIPIKNTTVKDNRFSDNTIDKLLAAPSKILIPERYIPEQAPELSPEELERRQQKAESIRKMLSTTSITPTTNNTNNQEGQVNTNEKRQREHLLQLNQILAKEVMEMSKIVAGSNTNSTTQ